MENSQPFPPPISGKTEIYNYDTRPMGKDASSRGREKKQTLTKRGNWRTKWLQPLYSIRTRLPSPFFFDINTNSCFFFFQMLLDPRLKSSFWVPGMELGSTHIRGSMIDCTRRDRIITRPWWRSLFWVLLCVCKTPQWNQHTRAWPFCVSYLKQICSFNFLYTHTLYTALSSFYNLLV